MISLPYCLTTSIWNWLQKRSPRRNSGNLVVLPLVPLPEVLRWLCSVWRINRLLHRKCAVRVFIHESQNFRNERVSVANEWVSKVLQRVNKIRTKHFLWCNLFVIYIRPISCNKPSKQNSVFFIFHKVKYKECRILYGRLITRNWPHTGGRERL